MTNLFEWMFGRFRREHKAAAESRDSIPTVDPLDPIQKMRGWQPNDPATEVKFKSIEDFPLVELSEGTTLRSASGKAVLAMDSADEVKPKHIAIDNDPSCERGLAMQAAYSVPPLLQAWYNSQSFIGYQSCAMIAQHWLVDKACSMAGEDATRHGWELKAVSEDESLNDEQHDRVRALDKKFKVKENLEQLNRFKNIFGIRIAIFEVESDDPDYYSKPFNIDGVTEGSYKGISQVDPYWVMPQLTAASTANPASAHFYEPEFWTINNKRYHRSHLIIARAPEPADILKPTYLFGGVPLTQRIYERVYAAERTANEAPLLAMNKRTTAIHVDVAKMAANQKEFESRLALWVKYRDNHAVKVLGKEEAMEQFDTSLADFDAVIMNQYQLVAAIAEVPATKLLGTSPKGFNATGEFEMLSYHEKLESIQEHDLDPLLDRHYMLLQKSEAIGIEFQHVWNPVDSVTAEKQAELNAKKSEMGERLINAGVISPDEERNRIRDDKHSGYNRLTDDDANKKPGMSPENLAEFEKAGAEKEQAAAAANGAAPVEAPNDDGEELPAPTYGVQAPTTQRARAPVQPADLQALLSRLQAIEEHLLPEGQLTGGELGAEYLRMPRTTKPGVARSVQPSVHGMHGVVAEMPAAKLPKLKVQGLLCVIENPRGSLRQGQTLDGQTWKVQMPHHYGYIKGVVGADGDELDCFIGPNPASQQVFVVNQVDEHGAFDEHKCMIGFNTAEEAQAGYLGAFRPGWDGLGSMKAMPMAEFKVWIASGNLTSEA